MWGLLGRKRRATFLIFRADGVPAVFASLFIKRTDRAFSVCVRNLFFSFVRRGGRAGNFLGAAPAFSGAVWGRRRPAAHGQGRCTVGCIVWRINYTPAAVCKSAEYSPWCIVCTKISPNKMRVYRTAICAPCGEKSSSGKGGNNEVVLRKNYQALSFSYRALSFSYRAFSFSYKVLGLQNVAVR